MRPETSAWTVTAFGQQRSWAVSAEGLDALEPGGPRRVVTWRDVRAVRLVTLGTLATCELWLKDGSLRRLANEDAAAVDAFKALLAAVHERLLASGEPVDFRRGSWGVVWLVEAVSAACLLVGVAGVVGWLGPPFDGRALLGAAFALPLAGQWVAFRSRPGKYEPQQLPAPFA